MTGIMATLKTHYALGVVREPVNNFAFTFIAPLRTNNDDIFCCAGFIY
jgi:hypothetical protein